MSRINRKTMKPTMRMLVGLMLAAVSPLLAGGPSGYRSDSRSMWLRMRWSDLSRSSSRVYYRPDRGRRMATYTTYIFNRQEFMRRAGSWKRSGSIRLKIRINRTEMQNTGSPAKGQSPVGGFRARIHHCSVIGGRGDSGRSSGNDMVSPAPGYPVDKRFTLRINPGEVRESGGKYVYRPGRGRRSAVYYTYYFSRSNYRSYIGSRTSPATVWARVVSSKRTIHKPASHMPQPMGGFRYYYITVRILGFQ